MARLILDTAVLVAAERSRTRLEDAVADDDDVAIAAVTAAELLVGVELADRTRHAARARFVAAILDEIRVEPYDVDTARAHARLLAHARRAGRPRGAHDLLIAATACHTERIVVTADLSGFEDLPGVTVRSA